MSGALRVLLVEDSPSDAKLVLSEVQRAGYRIESERVENQEAMLAALHRQVWDLILCDWALPRFSAMGALQTLKMKRLDIPFIIVSGTIGEEAAADALRSGAQDCVLKDRLARLVPAIERELREAKERAALRASEEALRVSESRFRALWNSGFVLINIGDSNGRIQEINDAGLRMLGYSREEFRAKQPTWSDLTAPESREADERARAELANQGAAAAWEMELLHKSGRRVPVLAGAATLDGGRIGIAIDLTSRKEAEARVRASEARFARLSESGIIGIVIADINGKAHEANKAYLDLIGYSREELLSGAVKWTSLTPREWHAADEAALGHLRRTGVAPPWEKELLRKDGSRVPVLIGVAMLEPPQCITFVADLTERKRTEAALQKSENQLRHAQKMEAVGRLAGGVAHDFNNILSVVLSYCATLLDDLREGDPLRDDVTEIQKAGKRAAALTRQLLMFSRQEIPEPRVLDLRELLVNMDKMLQRILGEDVDLLFLGDANIGRIRADPNHVEQVIMNLAVNARDAMPRGGKLTVELKNVRIDGETAFDHAEISKGDYVLLAISDTGSGMDKAVQARIFEPFFSTKEHGKGTGLGLSTVFGIVQQSKGHIGVYSEVGTGSTFKVYFPRVDAKPEAPAALLAPQRLAGTETILLVEDDDQLRIIAREILRKHGYRVLEARNASEALFHAEHKDGVIHLLVTDVVMPLMSGPDLAARLVKAMPDLRVIFMSGYTDDALIRHGVLGTGFAYLQKPLTPDKLAAKVRSVLDARTA